MTQQEADTLFGAGPGQIGLTIYGRIEEGEDDGSCYEMWSDRIADFVGLFEDLTGERLYGMSPQNETDFAPCSGATIK